MYGTMYGGGHVVFACCPSFYIAIMDTLFTNNVTKYTHDLNLSLVISHTVRHRSTTAVFALFFNSLVESFLPRRLSLIQRLLQHTLLELRILEYSSSSVLP